MSQEYKNVDIRVSAYDAVSDNVYKIHSMVTD